MTGVQYELARPLNLSEPCSLCIHSQMLCTSTLISYTLLNVQGLACRDQLRKVFQNGELDAAASKAAVRLLAPSLLLLPTSCHCSDAIQLQSHEHGCSLLADPYFWSQLLP